MNARRRRRNDFAEEACCLEEQHRHFSPFVVSADDLLGKEAKILPWQLPAMLVGM
jgi:hypothetical protein